MRKLPRRLLLGSLAAAVLLAAAVGAVPSQRPLLLVISIDGLKPEAVLEADRRGLKVPNLRAFRTVGAYATGVRGVLPTLTYPSHATLMTGVSPAKHGIYDNTTFDPLNRNEHGWYWYAEDLRVATLWDAAAAARLISANVYWPITVGAPITFNLPQIWRTGTPDDLKLQRALGTPGLEAQLSKTLGRFPGGMEETVAEDEIRTRFAVRLLESKHPDFMTVYLTGLDTEQHASGPFSEQSNAVLERLDAVVGILSAAAQRAAPGRATIAVVSDHGFAPVEHDVNLLSAFLQAGLFTVDGENKTVRWQAMPWGAGGSAAIMLADPRDALVHAQVAALLAKLASDPGNGIDQILSREQIQQERGFPDADFLVCFRVGYEFGSSFAAPLISAPTNRGMHGYPPDRPEMRSSFFLKGPRVPAGLSLGQIDMRRIAPTFAAILQVALPAAELPPLELK